MKKIFTLLFALIGLVSFGQIGGNGNPYLNSLRVKELYINHATSGYHLPFNRGTNGTFWTWQGDSLRARTILQSDLPATVPDTSNTGFWRKSPSGYLYPRSATRVGIGTSAVNARLTLLSNKTSDTLFKIRNSVTGNDTALIMLPNGYVGIGTAAPAYSLDVASIIRASTLLASGSNGVQTNLLRPYSATSNLSIQTYGPEYHVIINAVSSNVGIGTTTPTHLLSLGGNSARTIGMERHTTAGQPGQPLSLLPGGCYNTGTNLAGGGMNFYQGYGSGNATGTAYQFFTNDATTSGATVQARTVKATMLQSGFLGLGIASPAELLDINGRIKLAQTTAPGTTTDRLYNVGGTLYWNGTNLLAADTGKVNTTGGDMMYGNYTVTGWLKAKSGIFAVGHNIGITNAAEDKSVQLALSGSHSGNQTYTLPTAYPVANGMVPISQTDGTLSWDVKADVAEVQVFEASDTWTKPTGAKIVEVICIGDGGGGGSGRRGADGTARAGGGGGAGGAFSTKIFTADLLTSTVAVTVGTGGTGGAEVTTDNTNGADGNAGTGSTFGDYLKAGGGAPGKGGNTTAGPGGSSSIYWLSEAGGPGQDATLSDGDDADPTRQAASGGGPGGGITTGNVTSDGGNGGDTRLCATINPGGVGGDNTGTLNGSPGTASGKNDWYGGPAGGGGASVLGQKAGNGANGANHGGGGGGGGASENGYRSGSGGNGAPGSVVVITYF